jgi:drug/metabolite transporter (DMT)-like permease
LHAALAILGVLVMVLGIALASTGGSPGLAIAGSFLTIGSMLVFSYTVSRHDFGAAQASIRLHLSGAALTPAE